MAADEKWYFSKEQLANTPSRKCGYDVDKELSYRQQAANFIQDMGQRLLVTQLCINTAIVYMHRFYVFHSFTQFHRNAMAAASLFLAAKVEEQPRKLEHVIKVAHVCLHRDQPSLDTKSEAYLEQAQDLVFNENVLLQTLGFDVAIDHPHTHVVRCCHLVKGKRCSAARPPERQEQASKDLAQTSYFMASNSLHLTTMCLQYKPTVVACFCIHLACKWSNWEIPQSNEGKDWFWYVDKTVSLDQLEQLTAEFLVIFDKCPTKLKHKIKSISATQNTVMPQNMATSPFDMEPRKIRPPEGSSSGGLSLDGQGPSFRPHHPHPEAKPGLLATPEDPFKKQPAGAQPLSREHPPAPRGDYREHREKKERERQEREKMAQAGGNREGHHHHHHHHHHGQQPPSASLHHGKSAPGNKALQQLPPSHHLKPQPPPQQIPHDPSQRPNSAVTASREAARREQAHQREASRKRGDLANIRSEYMFGPPTRHDTKDPPVDSQQPAVAEAPVAANHVGGNVLNCAPVVNSVGRKDGQDWEIEAADGPTRHGTPTDKHRDKEGVRHSQSVDPSKRSGPNFDASSRHSSKVSSSDNRMSVNISAVSSDVRVTKDATPRGGPENASNAAPPKIESEGSHQKHLYNHTRHNRRVEHGDGQDPPKRPPPPGYDMSSKRVATPPLPVVKPSKSSEHRPELSGSAVVKREEEVPASNGKVPLLAAIPRIQVNTATVPSSHHHSSQDKHGHHGKSRDNKSPSVQHQHRSRSPAVSALTSVSAARSKSPTIVVAPTNVRPKSPSALPSSKSSSGKPIPSSQPQYYTPGQQAKPPESVSSRNGTAHHATPDEKRRSHVQERSASPPKAVDVDAIMSSPPVTTRTSQKTVSTPEKGGHSLRERESPYPQRQKRQRTPPASGKKQSLPPPPPPMTLPDMPAPVSPASGIMSPFGSPPPPTPTTPGKVLPSASTPASNRISTRNRTSSSSSEPELVPLVTKIDQMAGYENIGSRMSIKLPGRVPDIIQPIRDRKADEGVGTTPGAKGVSVAKELKPPELIRPFSTAQPGDMGAVAFPSPVTGTAEPDSSSGYNSVSAAAECAGVIDVISVTDPIQSPEKTVPPVPIPDISKPFPTAAIPSEPAGAVVETAPTKKSSSEHHHKSEKKKKKDKHKHKDKDKDKDKSREDRKKSKHKSKDRERHKDRSEGTPLTGTSAPIRITIPKDKLNLSSTLESPSAPSSATSMPSNSGLKLKIQKDRLKGADSTGASPQAIKVEPPHQTGGLKIKISKEVIENFNTNTPMSSGGKESRKRERSSPKTVPDQTSPSGQPPLKSARLSESSSRRGASAAPVYNKQNGVEPRSASAGGRGQQHYTVGTKMVAKLADSHNSQSKGKPPATGNQQ